MPYYFWIYCYSRAFLSRKKRIQFFYLFIRQNVGTSSETDVILQFFMHAGLTVGSIYAVQLQLQRMRRQNPFFSLVPLLPVFFTAKPFNNISLNFTRSFACSASLVHKLRACCILFVISIASSFFLDSLWSPPPTLSRGNPTYRYWNCISMMQLPFLWSLCQVSFLPGIGSVFFPFSFYSASRSINSYFLYASIRS